MTTSLVFKEKLNFKLPMAKGDEETAYEDVVGTIRIADILANDLGGAAKSLYGIHQTDPRIADMVATTTQGAKLKVDLAAGVIYYDPTEAYESEIQALAKGEIAIDTFNYTIRMADGTISTATVQVTLTGMNDKAYLTSKPGDSAGATLVETDAGLRTSGTSTLIDPDASDTVTVDVRSVKVFVTNGNPDDLDVVSAGGLTDAELAALGFDRAEVLSYFTVSPTGGGSTYVHDGTQGSLTWTFDSRGEAFDFLDAGQTLVFYYDSVRPNDGHGVNETGDGGYAIKVTGTPDETGVTLDFENVGPHSTPSGYDGMVSYLPKDYGGLVWDTPDADVVENGRTYDEGLYVQRVALATGPGDAASRAPGQQYVWTAGGVEPVTITREGGGDFDFESVWVAIDGGALQNTVVLTGYNDGVEVGQVSQLLAAGGSAAQMTADWSAIDTLVLTTTAGPGVNNVGLDDLTFSLV